MREITPLELETRIKKAKNGIFAALDKTGVPTDEALEYSETWAPIFVQNGHWPHECLQILGTLRKKYIDDEQYNIYMMITEAVKPHMLTFLEKATLGIQEVPEDELEKYKEDIEALAEMEALCSDDNCPVTEEHLELFQVLTQGLDPDKFDLSKESLVTKEEIVQFRELAPKFGLTELEIGLCIEKAIAGTPSAYVQRIINQQNLINARNEKNARILRRDETALRYDAPDGQFWRE